MDNGGHSLTSDWQRLHARLEASRASLERLLAPDAAAQQAILRTRAQSLSRTPEHKTPAEQSIEVVEFRLANETYAVESFYVQEVCPLRYLRTIPGAPPFVLGLMNVRGQILSVIDLKKFFELPGSGITDLNRVLILRSGRIEVGVLADAILAVREIDLAQLQAALPTLTGIRADYTKGITADPVVVLDVKQLLGDQRIIVQEG
jgi:purine-binding chemotaxis protein CheW